MAHSLLWQALPHLWKEVHSWLLSKGNWQVAGRLCVLSSPLVLTLKSPYHHATTKGIAGWLRHCPVPLIMVVCSSITACWMWHAKHCSHSRYATNPLVPITAACAYFHPSPWPLVLNDWMKKGKLCFIQWQVFCTLRFFYIKRKKNDFVKYIFCKKYKECYYYFRPQMDYDLWVTEAWALACR